VELDLRACPAEDADVAAVLAELRQLKVLHLSGCKKLSRALPSLLRVPAGDQGIRLQAVSLQRCFQVQ
jgi:hypothetical protein